MRAALAPPPSASASCEGLPLALGGVAAVARPSGALWVPALGLLAVADLHLGKAERLARRGGALLPPYETAETLARLGAEVRALAPAVVALLGDSFDDGLAARALAPGHGDALAALAAGRRWIWVAGNHDPAPHLLPGECAPQLDLGGLALRHVADPAETAPEVSGHYHPKASLVLRGRRVTRRCFLHEGGRLVLPAFGAYAGGLDATDPAFDPLFGPRAVAILTGARLAAAPRRALAPRAA